MADLRSVEFLALLKKSGLLTPPQLDSAQTIAQKLSSKEKGSKSVPDGIDASAVAAELVAAELITEWQASQLLKGQTGFVLQQYRLLMPVGRGGMGHVFKARDTKTGRIVAIKVMSKKLTGNQTLVNRFRREIRASSLLNSPHIVRTLDAGQVGKVDFMVMEYVNGDQVDRIASRISIMPVPMACDVIRQAAIGLQHAHEQKMVHRDLKPGNLIVDWSSSGNGTVKIMDMGLVRLGAEGDERTSVTKAGQVMGTPDYMSPEQGWDTATVDIRSDIYSLGCTLFRLLTGRVPFPGDNPLQVLMARCSRDAPSVKSIRSDIPDPVESIVRRMTLRDPAGRFQTPQELINALEPFSSPLTTTGLRSALKDAGEDEAILLEAASSVDINEPQDAGYQQFLREMDSGAAVDLMLSTTGAESPPLSLPLSPTMPLIPQPDRRVSGSRRTTAKRGRTASLIALASGIAMVAVVTLLLMVNGGNQESTPTDPGKPTVSAGKSTEDTVAVAKAVFRKPDRVLVDAGKELQFQPVLEQPVESASPSVQFRYQLGKGAPAGVEIDAVTGAIRWAVPREQTAADYDIPIELSCTDAGKSQWIASTLLTATVQAGPLRYSFPDREPMLVMPGEPVTLTLRATPMPDSDAGLEYRLDADSLPGILLDPQSGKLTWTPAEDQSGRNIITFQLYDIQAEKAVAKGSLVVLVRPKFSLPEFPEQSAQPGMVFSLQLIERPPRFFARVMQVVVKDGAPDGVQVDMRRGVLTWNVPLDAAGRYEIRLLLESLLPSLEFGPEDKTESLVVINVAGKPPASVIPEEEEIAEAEADLRELYKRDLGNAKSASDRAALALLLLERSEDQSPNATDYAMLNLVRELAEKSRATDIALAVNRIRSTRYGVSEITSAIEIADNFRSSGVSAVQADTVIENFLRIALLAAKESKFKEVATLLKPPEQLLRKQDRASVVKLLSDDVESCITVAEELAKGDPVTAADLKSSELVRRLERWQFTPVFNDASVLSYVTSGTSLEDSGRSLWTIDDSQIRLTATQQTSSAGILDPTREYSRYVLRMQLSAETTGVLLILGAGREQNLNAHLLTIDKAEFGRIVTAPGGVAVAAPATGVPYSNAGWNNIEILVDEGQMAIRLNGQAVSISKVPELKPGRLGLLVPLERTAMPKCYLRQARILVLPDTDGK